MQTKEIKILFSFILIILTILKKTWKYFKIKTPKDKICQNTISKCNKEKYVASQKIAEFSIKFDKSGNLKEIQTIISKIDSK